MVLLRNAFAVRFAVAAHLEPDVLIIDEVLAVGDAGFQKKCLDTMEGLRSGGRTGSLRIAQSGVGGEFMHQVCLDRWGGVASKKTEIKERLFNRI